MRVMTSLKAKPPSTIEDLYRLPPETRAELIEGEILMTPAPNFRHQRILGQIYSPMDAFVRARDLGIVGLSPLDVILPSGDVVQPDIVFVTKANLGILGDRLEGVPDLLIEILSPSNKTHDRIVKRDLYARNGVREYWIVDPDGQTMEVFTLAEGRYAPAGYFRVADTLRSPMLAGFTMPLSQVFALP